MADRGVLDVTIYPNGNGGTITAKGSNGTGIHELEIYHKDRRIYIKGPRGTSFDFIAIGGASPVIASLPSDAVKLTVTPY